MISPPEIIKALAKARFPMFNEKACQVAIFEILKSLIPGIQREKHLDTKNIIDFYTDGIGIEVKLFSSKRMLYEQCKRYCTFEEIKTIILLTSQSIGMPHQINGKDCYVLNLNKAWL